VQPPERIEDKIWSISRILDVKVVKGKERFLVRWQGFKSDADTWEPAESFVNAAILDEFKASRQVVS
jgi:hypothetical protein